MLFDYYFLGGRGSGGGVQVFVISMAEQNGTKSCACKLGVLKLMTAKPHEKQTLDDCKVTRQSTHLMTAKSQDKTHT